MQLYENKNGPAELTGQAGRLEQTGQTGKAGGAERTEQVELAELAQYHESLREFRRTWEPDWKELARHFLPRKCRLEEDSHKTNRGGLRGGQLDSTPYYAMRDLAAGLHGGMTSPARPWFRLALKDRRLTRRKSVKEWLDQVEGIMRGAFQSSNFYNSIHTFYGELGTFGTAFMFCLEDDESTLRFLPLTAGEFCISANASGRIDTVFHETDMTLRQIAERFGPGNMPENLQRMYEQKQNWAEYFRVVHAVFPRRKFGHEEHHMPFVSLYYLDGHGGGKSGQSHGARGVLRKSGYRSFPGFGVRWDVTGGDVYGVGPAMDTLADSRLLQQMTSSMLQAVHKEVNPPMVAPSGMEHISLLPGAVNYVNLTAGQGQAVYPAMQVRHNIADTYRAIEGTRRQVREGLFNDLFRMLLGSDRRQITAREVAAREEEKLILIGPVLERMHDELFTPLIERVFEILDNQGLVPPPPEEIEGAEIKIEFVSILAQAQKMVATGAVEQFTGFVGQIAKAFPEALDAINPDKAIDNYAEYLGVEANMLRGQDEREAIRQQRSEQQQAMAQQQQQMAGVDAVRKLGATNVKGSLLEALGTAAGAGAGIGALPGAASGFGASAESGVAPGVAPGAQ